MKHIKYQATSIATAVLFLATAHFPVYAKDPVSCASLSSAGWESVHKAKNSYNGGIRQEAYKKAYDAFSKGAENGCTNVMEELADFYMRKNEFELQTVTPVDKVYGYMWLILASEDPITGFKAEEKIKSYRFLVTPSERQEAQSLARKCRRSEYKNCG